MMPLGAKVSILEIRLSMFFALARIGSTAMKRNTTDGHVVNGVARQVEVLSYWLGDVFAVIPYVEYMFAKTIGRGAVKMAINLEKTFCFGN